MDRPLLAAGLGLFVLGQLYWTGVSLSFEDGLGIESALSVVSMLGILVGAVAVHRAWPGGIVLGFGLATVAEVVPFATSSGSPIYYLIPRVLTAAGFAMTTWAALATADVGPEVVGRRVGVGLLVAGIGGMAWLYGNLTTGSSIWLPGSPLVGAGAGLAFWELRRAAAEAPKRRSEIAAGPRAPLFTHSEEPRMRR